MSRLRGFASGASATLVATAILENRPPGGRNRWLRRNHADREVSLLAGPATAVGLAAASLATGGRPGRAAAAAVLCAAAAGAADDLTERDELRHIKGLRGHLGALRHGRLTTGAMKIAGIGLGALAAAAHLGAGRRQQRGGMLIDLALDATVIAGAANLINLFDLRPGRALKVSGIVAAGLGPTAAGELGGVIGGAVAAALPDDLAERTMLGDTGANALGAAIGTALVAASGRGARCAAAAAIIALTLASERVSFSAVIDDTPVLRAIDAWGGR
ncbi:MAG TPA: hypothetical protein VK024_09005 [Actinomycetaceae bacterium]|nr:hypothetical protein [Actinomycetaceae bacterium]